MKYFGILIILVSYIVIYLLNKKEKINNKYATFLKSILIAVCLEFTIFNINSYRLDISKNQTYTYSAEEIKNNTTHFKEDYSKVVLDNLDVDVKTIKLEFNSEDTIQYQICYSDNTTQGRYLPAKDYFQEIESSKYIATYFSGNVKNLEIRYVNTTNNNLLENITINEKIPFEFNIIRTCIIIFVIMLIYSFRTQEFWKKAYSEGNFSQQKVYFFTMALAMLVVYSFNVFNVNEQTDLYNEKFVEALESGQVHLIEEPSEKLLSLENPYDAVERNSIRRGIDYIWDAALYNNHYYVYFGILPALILFVPFHLITGTFLKTAIGVLIFSILSLLIMALIIEKIFKKYFNKLPFKLMFLSEIIFLFGSVIIWINVAPRFYEMVSIAGLYFALQGIYLFLIANSENYKKRICIGSLCLALAVACRPTTLIASIVIIPILWNLLKSKKDNKKNILKILLLVGIPYLLVGISLMYYNHIRFGSIFEFGARYQLTMNDMRNLKSRLITIPAGFICNLFNIPTFIARFPFIEVNSNIFEIFSYYYIEDMPGGTFILSPIAFFCIFGINKFFKKCKNKELKNLVITLLIVGIILNMIVVMQAGSTGRYLLDFSWCFVLVGILIFLENYQNTETKEARNILEKIVIGIAIFTLIINILTGFLNISGVSMKKISPKVYLNVEHTICFWK